MALFEWNDQLSVGIKQIDDQHKVLVRLLNDLHAAMALGKGREILGPTLTELTKYTVDHFALEERLMAQLRYPDFAKHKAAHDDLVRQVVDLKSKFDGGTTMLTLPVMTFLKNWLGAHIVGTDKSLGAFLQKTGMK